MNPNNYASLAASKRLVEAGIVLETDCIWVKWYSDNYPQGEWRLMYKALIQVEEFTEQYPAACFTEVWRELPETYGTKTRYLELQVDKIKRADGVIVTSANYIYNDAENGCCVYKFFAKENPTDALIELLVWVKQQNRERIIEKLVDRADKLKW